MNRKKIDAVLKKVIQQLLDEGADRETLELACAGAMINLKADGFRTSKEFRDGPSKVLDKEIIESAIQECDVCYEAQDVTGYSRIEDLLSKIATQTPQTEMALKLAEAGQRLSSVNFAYPYIKLALSNQMSNRGSTK